MGDISVDIFSAGLNWTLLFGAFFIGFALLYIGKQIKIFNQDIGEHLFDVSNELHKIGRAISPKNDENIHDMLNEIKHELRNKGII